MGCIDIDTYPFDHLSLIKKIREEQLPLIVFRSKSGGAHVYCFIKEFVPAILMRNKTNTNGFYYWSFKSRNISKTKYD